MLSLRHRHVKSLCYIVDESSISSFNDLCHEIFYKSILFLCSQSLHSLKMVSLLIAAQSFEKKNSERNPTQPPFYLSCQFGVFFVKFEQISHIFLVFSLLTSVWVDILDISYICRWPFPHSWTFKEFFKNCFRKAFGNRLHIHVKSEDSQPKLNV